MVLPSFLDRFFFERISARGFGLMRVSWAFFALVFLLMQWNDVVYYYSNSGILPTHLEHFFVRDIHRFTILEWVHLPLGVFCLYLILLTCLTCMMLGLWTRAMTIASVLLLFSFHERNPMILGGGDTLLRGIGFILMIAPGINGFSLDRLSEQWRHWKKTREFLPPPTMPIWPWRLLLWQMIVLYGTSLWYKSLGTMWWNGTAVEATFHHPIYTRFAPEIMNYFMPAAGVGDYLALFWQGAWLLLLIPRSFIDSVLPEKFPRIPFRRLMIFGGVFFHGGILLLMDAGIFSLAVYTAYLGLLREEDFRWLKKILNSWKVSGLQVTGSKNVILPKPETFQPSNLLTVLFDGNCGLCLRSIFTLKIFDWLGRLSYVNFREETARKKIAPDLTEKQLDKSMHIKLADGSYKTGFDAFRFISWHLPPLWPAVPFLYIPGIPPLGRRIYAKIADSRKKCDHESCRL